MVFDVISEFWITFYGFHLVLLQLSTEEADVS